MLSKYPWNQSIAALISPTKSPQTRSTFHFSNIRSRNSYKNDPIFNSNNSFRLPSILPNRNPRPFIELNPQSTIKHKYESKNLFLPKIRRSITKQFPETTFKCQQHLPTNENDCESISSTVDKEFQVYVKHANIKCANWLIKYVFDQKYDNDDNELC